MAKKPGYEELQQRVEELEAANAKQLHPDSVLEELFNLSLDMLCVATLDGFFRVINSAFETTLGYSRQVLLETPFIEFVHPDDQPATLEALSHLARGEPLPYFENRYRCKDGSYKWFAWTCAPVTEEGYLYAVARDITEKKSIQGELETQRDLFDTVLSNVPASIFWKDRHSVFLGVNEQFAREAGFQSPDELIGKSDYDLAWTKEQSDFFRECDRRVMDSGEPMLNIEEAQQRADGKDVTLLTSKVPLLDASGQVYGILGIYMDITGRKQMETSLQKSEARLRTLFDSAAEFIFVIDPEGRITNANREIYAQSGYTADEVIGSNIKDYFSTESKDICDCNFPGLRVRGYNRADVEFVCKDGRVLQMECSATAVPDEDGNFTSFLVIQRDMSERIRAAVALEESERRYHSIFNSTYQLIGLLDRNGILLEANQTALDLGGLRQEDVVGRPFWETAWWSYSDKVQQRLKDALQQASQGNPVGYEEEVLGKNGETRIIDFTLKPVVDEQGRTIFIISEGRDVTESRRAEEAIQRYQRELAHMMRLGTMGELASGMAHELNQPLTALVSYCGTAASMLNALSAPPEELCELLERAAQQAHRASDIIRHLRDFVSKEDEHKELLNMDQVIRGVINFLKYEVQESGVLIEFYPGSRNCRVKADKIQIDQVLINLVRNSLEAIGHAKITGGRVVLKTRVLQHDSVEVTVTDNGPGVDANMIDMVFYPFQTNKVSGMGIGLSLSYRIIEAHGGKLWVDRHYKDGASFGFELPISA